MYTRENMLRKRRQRYYAMDDAQLADAHLSILLAENGMRLESREDGVIFEGSYGVAFNPTLLRMMYGWRESRRILRLIRFASQNVSHRITDVSPIDFRRYGARIGGAAN